MSKTNFLTSKIDPHIDIADLYHYTKLDQADFFSNKDVPVSLAKLQQNKIKIVGASLYYDQSLVKTNFFDGVVDFHDWYQELLAQSDQLQSFQKFEELPANLAAQDKTYFFYTIEGFECLRKLEDIEFFYELGVRGFGPAWSSDNAYACGRHTTDDQGLSQAGKQVLSWLNSKKVLVDIAHLSQKSVQELAQVYSGIVVSSHSNLRSVHKTTHNLIDEEVDLIVQRGGVVSLFPLQEDTGQNGTFEELYRHLDYVGSKWGEDYIAFSSDIYPLPEYPFLEGYEDIWVSSAWEEYLLERLDKQTVKKIFYGNWLRVLEENL